MAGNNSLYIPSKEEQCAVVEYAKNLIGMFNSTTTGLHERMTTIDKAYQREVDNSAEQRKASGANKAGDPTKFQNIVVPVVLPQVEAAVTYQASVFLTGNPIFGVVASPQFMDEAMQMQTIIEDQATRGGWVREFIMFFRDGFKYNRSAIECCWDKIATAAVDTDTSFSATEGRPKNVVWQGNVVRRLDPYNTFADSRVPLARVHEQGEFAGYHELFSHTRLKEYIAKLDNKIVSNIRPAFESTPSDTCKYHVPEINVTTASGSSRNFAWDRWAGLDSREASIAYKNSYIVTTLYARVLPSALGFEVPQRNTVQIWKFVIVNGQVLIHAERQTNAHGYLPILFGCPLEDGLNDQTKTLAENTAPFQAITSALWNSVVHARRRATVDRALYDPTRIASEYVNNDSPTAKIPVKPSAYSKSVQDAYFPIPFRDDQSGLMMQQTDAILRMSDKVAGQNPAKQGQFVKGNKTLHEFDAVMGNANGRDQLVAMLYEAQVFTPLKIILKLNILQYQGPATLYNRESEEAVKIDPVSLRKAVIEFKVSDGLTPTDKLINSDILQVAMQMIGSSPVLSQEYNLGPLFSYLMKTQGARIAEFEKTPQQRAYEQALQAWQQATLEIAKAGGKQFPEQPTPQQFGYQLGQLNTEETPQGEAQGNSQPQPPTNQPQR